MIIRKYEVRLHGRAITWWYYSDMKYTHIHMPGESDSHLAHKLKNRSLRIRDIL